MFLFISEPWTHDGNCVETYITSRTAGDHSPMNIFAMKASDSTNDRVLTDEELKQEPTVKRDGIAMNSKSHINKEEEGVILDTEGKRVSLEYQRIQSPCFSTKGGSKLNIHGTIESNEAKFKSGTACRNVLCLSTIPIARLNMIEI